MASDFANPLVPSNGNNNITNTLTLPDSADGASIFKWAGTKWADAIPTWIAGAGWVPDADMNLGESFFLQSPVATKVTFVGEVKTGNIDYSVPAGLSAIANKVPVAEPFPGNHGNDGDAIYTWAGTTWNPATWSYIAGLGWSNGGAAGDNVNGPTLAVGEGIIYQNTATAPVTWTRAFNP